MGGGVGTITVHRLPAGWNPTTLMSPPQSRYAEVHPIPSSRSAISSKAHPFAIPQRSRAARSWSLNSTPGWKVKRDHDAYVVTSASSSWEAPFLEAWIKGRTPGSNAPFEIWNILSTVESTSFMAAEGTWMALAFRLLMVETSLSGSKWLNVDCTSLKTPCMMFSTSRESFPSGSTIVALYGTLHATPLRTTSFPSFSISSSKVSASTETEGRSMVPPTTLDAAATPSGRSVFRTDMLNLRVRGAIFGVTGAWGGVGAVGAAGAGRGCFCSDCRMSSCSDFTFSAMKPATSSGRSARTALDSLWSSSFTRLSYGSLAAICSLSSLAVCFAVSMKYRDCY
eukprot:Sspe_Gene.14884::Locus_5167_Transcript_1_1_Confidence_1.000_Length_3727::g.14884::m.14884